MIQFLICWQIFLWGPDCTEWERQWGWGWKPHGGGHITGWGPFTAGQQTHTQLEKSTNASYEWRSEILQCDWSTNTFLLKTITFWGFICLPLGLGFAQFAFNFLYILWHFNVWHFSLQSIDIIFLECSHVQGYEFPTHCIVNYRLSVLGNLRHTCPGALLFLVQSGYIFLHRWGRIPSLDI